MSPTTFGSLIRTACKTLGVSHSELARRLRVSQPRVQEIIRSPSLTEKLFRRCVAALGCDVKVELVLRQPATQAPHPVKMARRKK